MNLKTTLFKHQQDAVDKLKGITVGALFMEMGTGKTLTAMELIRLRWHKISRVVWLCPVSVRQTIKEQFEKHSDQAPVIYVAGDEKPTAKVVIAGIETLQGSDRAYLMMKELITPDTYVVVDESSFIKTPDAVRTERIIDISKDCKYKLILTGTSVTRYISDLWSQFHFLSPKILGYNSYCTFERIHLIYDDRIIGRVIGVKNQSLIVKKIEPYVFQIRKHEAITLPPKTYTNRYCRLTSHQEAYYNRIKAEFFDKIVEEESKLTEENEMMIQNRISTLTYEMFTHLQKIVQGYTTSNEEAITLDNEKENTLIDALNECPDEKVVIWCKYTHDVKTLKKLLTDKYGVSAVSTFYGELDPHERNESLTKFRGPAKYLLITPSCGGFGIDLTCSHVSIFYGHTFDYALRAQAEDRTHRIGQAHKVTYINIVTKDTIDFHIVAVIERKDSLIASLKQQIAEAMKNGKLHELIKNI